MTSSPTPRGYPYPIYGGPPDVPGDLQALAEAIDADVTTALGRLPARIQSGTVTGAVTTGVTTLGTVTFAQPFTSTPRVVVSSDITTGGGEASAMAISVSTTGFAIRVKGSAAATGREFHWIAVGS